MTNSVATQDPRLLFLNAIYAVLHSNFSVVLRTISLKPVQKQLFVDASANNGIDDGHFFWFKIARNWLFLINNTAFCMLSYCALEN